MKIPIFLKYLSKMNGKFRMNKYGCIRTKSKPRLCPIEYLCKLKYQENLHVGVAAKKLKLSVEDSIRICNAIDFPLRILSDELKKLRIKMMNRLGLPAF